MAASTSAEHKAGYEFYGPHYRRFGSEVAARIRREVYGEDHGQTGWRTTAEQLLIGQLLLLDGAAVLLDIACGSGGPSLALAASTGCRVLGLDIEPAGIAHAQVTAEQRGLAELAEFKVVDCGRRLPFNDAAFGGALCRCHFQPAGSGGHDLRVGARAATRGRLLFTDALVMTGEITKPELDLRASQGVHLIVPVGCNEAAIAAAGLVPLRVDDTTSDIALIAQGLHDARARHADELGREEDAAWFGSRQRSLATTAQLAASRRMSRFLYLAEKPMA